MGRMSGTPITFAHRGARAEEPENTLSAFRRALELGASGLESDAWLSADREVVLVHDDVFWRGIRRVRVAHTPADRLARLGVPRLADLYRELGTDFELSLDVKDRAAAGPIMALAAAQDASERLWLCSPSLRFLRSLLEQGGPERGAAHLVHSTSRRHLSQSTERHAADLADAGIAAMNMHHSEWGAGQVTPFHASDV